MKTKTALITQQQLKKQIQDVLQVYILTSFYSLSALLFPQMLSALVGQAADGRVQRWEDIVLCIALLLFCTMTMFLSGRIRKNAANDFSYALRESIWGHNLYAEYAQYRSRDTDADFQIITMDSDEMGVYYFQTLPGIFLSGLLIVGSLFGMCSVQSQADILWVVLLVMLGLGAVLAFLKKIEELEREYIEERSRYFSYLVKVMDQIRTLKLFVLYKKVSEQISKLGGSTVKKGVKKGGVKYMQTNLLQVLSYVLLTSGLVTYIGGRMQLAEFLLYEQYTAILTSQMTVFITYLNASKKKKVLEQKLGEMLLSEEACGETRLDAVREVAVEHINFYFQETKQMYQNFSCRFETGKCYLLKAPNGFGKTTLFELMTGIERPAFGRITYNSMAIGELDMDWMRRKQICYLMQEDFFYENTLQENINDYLDGVTEKDLEPYLKKLHLDIQEKEGDFNKILSGGQRKKLALAIMMKKAELCKNPVIFMDEPTNMLDVETIETVVSYVSERKKDTLIIIISHDVQFDAVADEILWLAGEVSNNDKTD